MTHEAGRVIVRANPAEGDTLQGVFAGLAEPMTIDGTFTTPFHEVTPGAPLVVGFELILSATAGGSGGAGGANLALADFDPGLGFAATGPVFVLPDGYTAVYSFVDRVAGEVLGNLPEEVFDDDDEEEGETAPAVHSCRPGTVGADSPGLERGESGRG